MGKRLGRADSIGGISVEHSKNGRICFKLELPLIQYIPRKRNNVKLTAVGWLSCGNINYMALVKIVLLDLLIFNKFQRRLFSALLGIIDANFQSYNQKSIKAGLSWYGLDFLYTIRFYKFYLFRHLTLT